MADEKFYGESNPRQCAQLIVVAAVVHLIAVGLAQLVLPTPQDVRFELNWLEMGRERGILLVYSWSNQEVYERFQGGYNANYPPLVFWIYYPGYYLAQEVHIWPTWPSAIINAYFRLPIAVAQWLLFIVVLQKSRRNGASAVRRTFLLFGANPALLLAGPVWGQFDVVLSEMMLLSLIAQAEGRDRDSGCWAGLGAMLKPQFLLFVPILFWIWCRDFGLRRFAICTTAFLIVILVVCLPFSVVSGTECLSAGYSRAVASKPGAVTTTAFNLWWIYSKLTGTDGAGDRCFGVSLKYLGMIGAAAIGSFAGVAYASRAARSRFGLAAVHLLGCFVTLTGLSERFLVFGLAAAAVWAVHDRRMFLPAVCLSGLQIVNLMHNAFNRPGSRWAGWVDPGVGAGISLTASFLVLGALIFLMVVFMRGGHAGPSAASRTPEQAIS